MNARTMTLTLGMLILACQGTMAATLYVASDGSDANPGTEEKPFATLEAVPE